MRLTSLPLQLLALVVLPLLALLVLVAFGGVAVHQTEMRDLLINHNRQLTSAAAVALSGQLEQRQNVLLGLARAAENAGPDEVMGQLELLIPLFDRGLVIDTQDGQIRAASGPEDNDWQKLVDEVRGVPTPSVLARLERDGNRAQAVLINVVSSDQGLRAIGLGSLDLVATEAGLGRHPKSGTLDIRLLDRDGTVLLSSNPAQVGEVFEGAERAIQTDGVTAFERTDSAGHDVILTAAPVPLAGWALVYEERWHETLSPIVQYSQAAPLVLVPGLLIALGAVWFGIRRVVLPLRKLEAQANELAWGNYAAIGHKVGGIEEIQHLQGTLQQMSRRVQAAQASMHDYIGAITRAQEEERRRLAHELHDQTAQSLVALDHRQQMLKPHLRDDPAAAARLAEIRGMIAATIDDLRRIVRALRPVYLEELGLTPALEMLARDLERDGRFAIHFEKHGAPQRLAPEQEVALYRIAQEALNNAWQHSSGSDIWLIVRFDAGGVTITVRDNGKGFAAPQHASELGASGVQHFGLMGMYERASLIGAHLQVLSKPEGGTTVVVSMQTSPVSSSTSTNTRSQ
jgi:signal transduction histidine kinase